MILGIDARIAILFSVGGKSKLILFNTNIYSELFYIDGYVEAVLTSITEVINDLPALL